jgi:tRNA(fMet)-specific endonuclease VapC
MSLLLLDTAFLIDAERGDIDLDDAIDDLAIAAVTVAELIVGIELASRKQRTVRRAYVDAIIESLPIIAYDRNVAFERADLLAAVRSQGRPRSAHDLLIAATARATRRTVVTADRAAFTGLPGVSTVEHC